MKRGPDCQRELHEIVKRAVDLLIVGARNPLARNPQNREHPVNVSVR
jgi:hypothetical protein